ncbi:MAG TPA: 30S ribosomal protein S12 methylthiotransferase RimO [Bacteroidales bacterium]|nr:30S ribosomal protein S12 methylthiotransferase RimO [Bacteroidales bacterium]
MFLLMEKFKTANLITMGCSKNLVDSEKLAWQLQQQGWKAEHEAEIWSHDIVFLNTCGFINDAKEESIEMMLDLVAAKSAGKVGKIVVFGCLVERYGEQLKQEIPEIDAWLGNYSTPLMMRLLNLEAMNEEQRINSSFGHYAFLKIAEGCDRKCSYCAIPLIKGKYISRPVDAVVKEAEILASEGVRELLVIAQDLSFYGLDVDGKNHLPELVHKLTAIEGIEWVRLHYLYPNAFPTEILDMMRNNSKLCAYLDIPLQHISDSVLKKMRRATNRRQTETILQAAREKVPGIALRTTMLVGHPGETEADFQELMEFVEKWKFDRLGVFTYSEEEGTFGASRFDDSIPEAVKQERAEALMDLQEHISLELNQARVGNHLKVIIDRREGGMLVGRSQYDSVEVDNEIFIHSDQNPEPGTFCEIEISAATAHELEGKLIKILP